MSKLHCPMSTMAAVSTMKAKTETQLCVLRKELQGSRKNSSGNLEGRVHPTFPFAFLSTVNSLPTSSDVITKSVPPLKQ